VCKYQLEGESIERWPIFQVCHTIRQIICLVSASILQKNTLGGTRGSNPKKEKLVGEKMESMFDATMKVMKVMKLEKDHKLKLFDIEFKAFIASKTGGFHVDDNSTVDASTTKLERE